MKEKVILLSIGNDYPRYEEHVPAFPPMSILALGSYLAAQDVPVELLDVQMDFGFGLTSAAEQVVCQRVARYLQSQADAVAWVGISQLSNASSGILLAQEIRAALPETPIIFGGYFPSCNYELLLRKYPFITAIVRGDGEAAALQISRSLAHGQPFLCDQTPNLAWLDAGGLHTTPIQSMALNNLPIFDFRLLRNRSCYQTGSLMTSRGCPFSCNYCTESGMRPYAVYPAEWVARQLEHMKAELQCRRVIVMDPMFGAGRERTLEMCRILREHHFTYGIQSRVDVLRPDLISRLRQVGLEMVFWGVESASPSTLLRMNKVRSKDQAESYLQDTLKVLQACFENSVVPLLGLMLGFPGDTEADLQASLEFVKEVDQLRNQVLERTGVNTGFIPYSQPTQIYDGTPLAGCLAKDFQVTLSPDPFAGERTVLSPSPGLSMDTVSRYMAEINNFGHYTQEVEELVNQYIAFFAKDFVTAHPELTDDEGVTILNDAVQRFPSLDDSAKDRK
jgi:hypothetical protein